MNYSILIFESRESFDMRTDPKHQADYWSGVASYLQALQESGVFVGGAGLDVPQTAKTIRPAAGKQVVQDGPYADTKEQLGGLFIVNVPSIEDALRWGSRFPNRPGQLVEVRPNLPSD